MMLAGERQRLLYSTVSTIQNSHECIIYVYLYQFHNCSFQVIGMLAGGNQNNESEAKLTGSHDTYNKNKIITFQSENQENLKNSHRQPKVTGSF